jgi:hypothetical protein
MDAIALNNNAVDLMRQGQRSSPTFDQFSPDFFIGSTTTKAWTLSTKCLPITSRFECSLENSLFHASSHQDHHAFSLFDRALVIDDAKLAATSSIAGRDSTTAVVLFNTGLALHLQGRRNICLQQTSLKKALQLYTMAVNILEKRLDSGDGDEVNRLVYLAAVNNMGHIYSHFCEGENIASSCYLLRS